MTDKKLFYNNAECCVCKGRIEIDKGILYLKYDFCQKCFDEMREFYVEKYIAHKSMYEDNLEIDDCPHCSSSLFEGIDTSEIDGAEGVDDIIKCLGCGKHFRRADKLREVELVNGKYEEKDRGRDGE